MEDVDERELAAERLEYRKEAPQARVTGSPDAVGRKQTFGRARLANPST